MASPSDTTKLGDLLPRNSMWSGGRATVGRFVDGKKFVHVNQSPSLHYTFSLGIMRASFCSALACSECAVRGGGFPELSRIAVEFSPSESIRFLWGLLFRIRLSGKTDSQRIFSTKYDFPKIFSPSFSPTFSLTEKQLSRKTYFYREKAGTRAVYMSLFSR